MKTFILFGLYFLFCFNSYSQFNQTEFIIGTFSDPELFTYEDEIPAVFDPGDILTNAYLDKLQLLNNAHYNLLSGWSLSQANHTSANIYRLNAIKYFNENNNSNIKMLVKDDRFNHFNSTVGRNITPSFAENNHDYDYLDKPCSYCNEDGYLTLLEYKNLSPELKNILYGFHLFDEPIPKNYNNVLYQSYDMYERHIIWNGQIKLNFPDKPVFINLLPDYSIAFSNQTEYWCYLNDYLSNTSFNLEIGCYDYYPFFMNGNDKIFKNGYYNSLKSLRSASGEKPFWAYVNIVEQNAYTNETPITAYTLVSDPTEAELRLTSFSPLAYGAKGLIHFIYQGFEPCNSEFQFVNSPLNKCNSISSKYFQISNINNFIKNVPGPIIMNSLYKGTFHVSNSTNEIVEPSYLNDTTNNLIQDISNPNILVGVFESKSKEFIIDTFYIENNDSYGYNFRDTIDTHYFWIVNKDYENSAVGFNVNLFGWQWESIKLSPKVGDLNSPFNPIDTFTTPTHFKIMGTTSNNYTPLITQVYIPILEPGEGQMIMVKSRRSYSDPMQNVNLCDNDVNVSPNPMGNNSINISNYLLNSNTSLDLKLIRVNNFDVFPIKSGIFSPGEYNFSFDSSLLPSASMYYLLITTGSGCQLVRNLIKY